MIWVCLRIGYLVAHHLWNFTRENCDEDTQDLGVLQFQTKLVPQDDARTINGGEDGGGIIGLHMILPYNKNDQEKIANMETMSRALVILMVNEAYHPIVYY